MTGGQDTRLPVPSWPTPLTDEEFIRSTGIIRKRPKGGLHGWIAEERYCDAHRSIKFDSETVARVGLRPWNFRIAFRRFYFDGTAVAKFEIGFATRRRLDPSRHNALNELLSALLTLPVRVTRPGKQIFEGRLIDSGKALATLYASASNQHRWRGPLGYIQWRQRGTQSLVISGSPAVFIEIAPQDIDETNLPNSPELSPNLGDGRDQAAVA